MKSVRFYQALLLAVVGIAAASPASSEILIDTGSPASTQNGAIAVCAFAEPTCGGQFVALGFNLGNSYEITGIQSYLYTLKSGDLTLALYRDNFGAPGVEIFSQPFSVTSSREFVGSTALSWLVGEGSYWASFEVRPGQSFLGAMEFPAPIQLPAAVKNSYYKTWTNIGGGGGGGLIVSGNVVAAVPEPEILAMLLAGLGLIGAVIRRNRC